MAALVIISICCTFWGQVEIFLTNLASEFLWIQNFTRKTSLFAALGFITLVRIGYMHNVPSLARQCQYLLSDSKRNCLQSHLFTGLLQLYDRERDESADDVWEDVRVLVCTGALNFVSCILVLYTQSKLATEPLSTWQGLLCKTGDRAFVNLARLAVLRENQFVRHLLKETAEAANISFPRLAITKWAVWNGDQSIFYGVRFLRI